MTFTQLQYVTVAHCLDNCYILTLYCAKLVVRHTDVKLPMTHFVCLAKKCIHTCTYIYIYICSILNEKRSMQPVQQPARQLTRPHKSGFPLALVAPLSMTTTTTTTTMATLPLAMALMMRKMLLLCCGQQPARACRVFIYWPTK